MPGAIKKGPTKLPAGLYVDEALQVTMSAGDGTGLQISLTPAEAVSLAGELLVVAERWGNANAAPVVDSLAVLN